MDQYLVAMAAVVVFAGFVAVAIIREIRKDNRVDREPSEHGGSPL